MEGIPVNARQPEQRSGPWTKAKNRVQEHVSAWAEGNGIDPKQILFKWDIRDGLALPEHGIKGNQTVCVLTVFWGRRSQAITFSGPTFSRSNENPEAFLSENKDRIISTLKKLTRPDRRPARK